MGRTFDRLDDDLVGWLADQPVFFVATAPREGGHVNLSPKGYDAFRVLGPTRVAYLDLTGSGAETVAHLRDDGRITFMFCAFSGPPQIVRLQGRGRYVQPGEAGWDDLAGRFPDLPGARAVVVADLDRIATSCGYGVPEMELIGPRDRLLDWEAARTPEALAEYRSRQNAASIDGLPAFG